MLVWDHEAIQGNDDDCYVCQKVLSQDEAISRELLFGSRCKRRAEKFYQIVLTRSSSRKQFIVGRCLEHKSDSDKIRELTYEEVIVAQVHNS